MRLKSRVYEIVEVARPGDRLSLYFDVFILSLIALNVVALILQSMNSIYQRCPVFFDVFETVSVVIFTGEYLLRIWSCTEDPKYAAPVQGRLRFALTPFALVDLAAVLPFWLPFVGVDLRSLRAVRLLRVVRVLKVGRYSSVVQTFARVLGKKKEELLATIFLMMLLLVMASSLMYFAENDAQPDRFSSIPATMWWGIATLTTVGYGDLYPVTSSGKAIASLIAVLGIAMFALPAGILGAAFSEEFQEQRRTARTCPHCGRELPS
jgi:voltage-gated potassium channel